MSFNPYLFFSGDCQQAFAFYSRVFGVDAQVMTAGDVPDGMDPMSGAEPHHVMHASIDLGGSYLMGSDDPTGDTGPKRGIAVSYTAPDPAAAQVTFDNLAEGGTITLPVSATFWSPAFGMLIDRFGVSWMVDTYPAEDPAATG